MGVLRVGGYSKDLSVEFLELAEGIVEGKDFGWTNKGKVPEVLELSAIAPTKTFRNVHRIEEQDDPVRERMVSDVVCLISGSNAYHLPRKSEREISWKTEPTTAVVVKAGAGR